MPTMTGINGRLRESGQSGGSGGHKRFPALVPSGSGARRTRGISQGQRRCFMNIAWAKDWMSKFNAAGLDQLASMYAERVDFEDVTLAHKAGSREELKSFFEGF